MTHNATRYRVYAIDLLGFGATDKPVLEYKAELWRDECAAFLREVAGCGPTKRAVVAGNSIGGYTALALASTHPELVRGCASLCDSLLQWTRPEQEWAAPRRPICKQHRWPHAALLASPRRCWSHVPHPKQLLPLLLVLPI